LPAASDDPPAARGYRLTADRLADLSGQVFDVAIIGAGINGASAAQQLAAAGYRVLVVERRDFGSGASSRSSRLLHCGLRYLAPGRSIFDFIRHPSRFVSALRMARLAMQARSEFVRSSGARARPLRFCFPIFKDGPYRGWQVDTAFATLRHLGPKDLPLDYRRISPAEAAATPLLGWLRDFGSLQSVATFREYQLDWPERICVDLVLDAERLGATALNYTSARLAGREERGWKVELRASRSPDDEPASVIARTVLNMAGIWIDEVNRAARPDARRRILGTKGCHIVVKLPPECAEYGIATLNTIQEPFYCIPWRGYHYFGPTETPFDGDKDDISVTPQERSWLVKEANRLLPQLALKESDVLMSWAGVRPLTYDEHVPFGNRARTIHDLAADGLDGVLAMTAGPVMSHRSAGREMAEAVALRLAPSAQPAAPDYTPRRFPDNQNTPPLLADDGRIKLSDLRHAAREEHGRTLSDILFRRVGVGWDCALSDDEVGRAAEAVGGELGWDRDRQLREAADFQLETSRLFSPQAGLRPRRAEERRYDRAAGDRASGIS
jgi:glycerol-3-phosphate dehydrogenase